MDTGADTGLALIIKKHHPDEPTSSRRKPGTIFCAFRQWVLEKKQTGPRIRSGVTKILIVLAMTGSGLVFGDQATTKIASGTEMAEGSSGAKASDDLTPATDKKGKKKKQKDPNRGRFLPIPIFITEPAIGDGFGLAVAYFHRSKVNPEEGKFATPESISHISAEQAPPPTVTGVFAAGTNNGTVAAGIGHMNSFKDDHIRFTGVVGVADANSTFYLLDHPFKFNLKGTLALQETRFRFRDSGWFWGIGLSYLDASVAFKQDLPGETPFALFPDNLKNMGVAAKLAWDTRDNTSMPNKGQLFDLATWRYDDAIGGDYDYWNARLKLLSFHRLHEKFVLGLRFEYSSIDGRAPFFAIPWVTLRGIPALRYQGDRVGVAEIEGRYNFTPKWALIGFAGKGAVSSKNQIIDTEQNIYSFGLGGRYRVFEAQNVWVGIDIARGPEDTNWYIQVGHAW